MYTMAVLMVSWELMGRLRKHTAPMTTPEPVTPLHLTGTGPGLALPTAEMRLALPAPEPGSPCSRAGLSLLPGRAWPSPLTKSARLSPLLGRA